MTRGLVNSSLIALFLVVQLSACGGGPETGGGAANINSLPEGIVGESISFTLETAGGASVANGLTIVYDFAANGDVVGTNPETNIKYTPQSYTYSANANKATVRLDYGNLAPGAYEEYRMTATSCKTGTYESTSFDTILSATSTGVYSIVSSTCVDDSGGSNNSGSGSISIVNEVEPNNTAATAQVINAQDFLAGTVNYSTTGFSGDDQFDIFSYTANSNGFHVITLTWLGNRSDLELAVDSNATIVDYKQGGNELQTNEGKAAKYIYLNLTQGQTYNITATAIETSGNTAYNMIVVDRTVEDPKYYDTFGLAAGTWDITETMGVNTCGFAQAEQPVFQATIRQTGSVIAITSSQYSTLVGKIDRDSATGAHTASWTGSYPLKGGTITITDMNLTVDFDGQFTTRDGMSGEVNWTWSDGGTNCSGAMTLAAIAMTQESIAYSGVSIVSEPSPPVVACCTVTASTPPVLEQNHPGSLVGLWFLRPPLVLLPSGVGLNVNYTNWQVTVEGGNASFQYVGINLAIVKLYTQAADWQFTLTDPITNAKTTLTGRIEASLPAEANTQFLVKEPKCLENFPQKFCNAIANPASVGLPAKDNVFSSFTANSTSCMSLGYDGRESTIFPLTSPGAEVNSTCTYRE